MARVCLSITSWKGLCPGAVHHYGSLREWDEENPDPLKVDFRITAADAARINEEDRLTGTVGAYREGDLFSRFRSRRELEKMAVVVARETYGENVEVYLGNYAAELKNLRRLA